MNEPPVTNNFIDYRRWRVFIASCFANLCIGSIYAWSVFAGPMAIHLDMEAGQLAIIFSVANSVGPITMILGGKINDKFGPRWVVMAGGLFYGGGFILSGFSNNFGMLAVSYGLGVGIGMGLVYGCTINNSIKFFPDKRGLIGGIATAMYGLSSVVVPPIANALITNFDVLYAFRTIGVVFLVVICIAALFIEKCPQDYAPLGWEKESNIGSAPVEKDWRGMLASPVFYAMFGLLICGAFYGLMVISQASPIAQRMIGLTPSNAAICVSILSLFNMLGRVLAGALSDRLGRIKTLVFMLAVALIGFLLLLLCGPGKSAIFVVGISAIGLSFGAFMGVFPGFTADEFGSRHNSVNYGIMFIAFAVGGVAAPLLLNSIYELFGDYRYGFLLCITIVSTGLFMAWLCKKIKK